MVGYRISSPMVGKRKLCRTIHRYITVVRDSTARFVVVDHYSIGVEGASLDPAGRGMHNLADD
jgi:hypothetical protein